MQHQEGSTVVTRYKYNRMTPKDFSGDLNSLGLSAGQFSRLSGARYERVLKWLDGQEDIPPHVPVMLALLELPGAMAQAQRAVNFYIREEGQ
jgi:hypothetical protein